MRWVVLMIAVLILAVACGRQKSAAPAAPSTPQPKATTPAVVAQPTPTPAPPRMLPPYPGATETGTLNFRGKGPTGAHGQWLMTTFETTDSFDKVWNFYSDAPPRGFSQSFSSVQNPGEGRTFLRWFVRADGKAWLTITIKDEKMEQKVTITLTAGFAN